MAKQKNVDINGKSLEAVTLGEVKQSKFGLLKLIIIFAIFGSVIFFAPELGNIYQDYILPIINPAAVPTNTNTNRNTNTNTNINTNTNENITADNIVSFNETSYIVGSYSFTNVTFTNKVFSFDAVLTSVLDANKNNLFVELYNDNTMVQRVLLNNDIPSTGIHQSYDVDVKANKYTFKFIGLEDYDYFTLDIDEDKKSTLTCSLNNEVIEYIFTDEKLTNIKDTVSISRTSVAYSTLYSNYKNLEEQYNSLNDSGLKVTTLSDDTIFKYELVLDYKLLKSEITNQNYFKKDATPREVAFIMDARLFDCK